MSKQKIHSTKNTIKSGDSVIFNTHSFANAETYKGVVEYKDQLGLVVFVNGVQYEIGKMLNIRKANKNESMNKKDVLNRKLSRLRDSLKREQEKTTRVMNNIGWGAGMRRTKCTPSFRREDEIKEKIEEVELQLASLAFESSSDPAVHPPFKR